MAATEENGDSERPGDPAVSILPGALSALLQQLAHVSEVAGGGDAGPRPGDVIGRFEMLRKIGGGGFGVVYEARDSELHRSVAFKLVRPGRLDVAADQLGREAEVIAKLSHPNLVTLFDVGRCDHGPYLVLELLHGETLLARLGKGPVPVPEAIRVALGIAKGLAHAHAHGVVHRDLKPSNVFLCEGGQPKLLDFGMSHAFGRRRVEGGTPSYMAPEQWRGAPEDERTDVYALGVMLFQMLARELPFRCDDDGSAVLSERRAPALEVPGAPALGELVARMLEKDPTNRPRDAAEVVALLSTIDAELQGGHDSAGRAPTVRRRRRAWALVAAGAMLGAGASAAMLVLRARETTPPRARAIAVLPFVNVSESADNEYFSDGLTEEILHTLTRLRELKVAARSSSFYFKNKKVQVAEVAQRLGVDVVLDGTVRRDRDRLRIAAELIDVRSGFRMWSQTYDRRLEDVFAIQDDIARRVVAALEVVLSRTSESGFERPHAASVATYDLYLRARAYLRLPSTPENLDRAVALLEQSLAADPGFAQAYAGLCDAWLASYELTRANESFERAEAACDGALKRDRDRGEVYVSLGNLHLLSGRYEQAERELRQAASLPNATVDALLGLARSHEAQRRMGEAERAFEQAARLDPGYWRVHQLRGRFYFYAGRYAEAAKAYAEEVARTPDDPKAHSDLGAAYYQAGDLEMAAAAWRVSLELAPTSTAYSNVGTSYYFLGRFADAAAMYAKAVEIAPRDHRFWGNLGDAEAQVRGREAEAAAAYRSASRLGEERLRVNPADARVISNLAHYQSMLGNGQKARELIARALGRDPGNAFVHYNAALVNARLGERDAALAELERAVTLGHERHLLDREPALEPIRGDPRFKALLAKQADRPK